MRYTPCHAEEADRLTKHLLPMHTVEVADSSTPLRSAQNDSTLMTSDLEVTHDVVSILRTVFGCRRFFEINKLDEAKCFIFNLGLHPEFDKKTGHSINHCFIETKKYIADIVPGEARKIAQSLVEEYPEHGFVIDSDEAKKLG